MPRQYFIIAILHLSPLSLCRMRDSSQVCVCVWVRKRQHPKSTGLSFYLFSLFSFLFFVIFGSPKETRESKERNQRGGRAYSTDCAQSAPPTTLRRRSARISARRTMNFHERQIKNIQESRRRTDGTFVRLSQPAKRIYASCRYRFPIQFEWKDGEH